MAGNGGRNLGTCLGAAPSKDTLVNIFKEFGPTAMIYGAVAPVALFLKDLTTSKTDMAFKDVQDRAHSVANKLSILMAASGILDVVIAGYDNYQVREKVQSTQGKSYALSTPGKIAIALDAAAAGAGIYAIQCSGSPGHELNTIASAFASGVAAKGAAVFHKIDTTMVREGRAPLKWSLGAAAEQKALAQPAGDAYVRIDDEQHAAAASAPPGYRA